MSDSWSILISRALLALPEAVDERRAVLQAAAELLPQRHPLWRSVTDSLGHLDHHLAAQQELSLVFDATTRGGRRLSDRIDVRGGGRLDRPVNRRSASFGTEHRSGKSGSLAVKAVRGGRRQSDTQQPR